MKTIQILSAILLLFASAHGQTSLVSAGRFIHLRSVVDGEQDDTYVRAEAIDAVLIYRMQRGDGDKVPFKVQITTRMLTDAQRSSPEAWSTVNRRFEVDSGSREEAEKIAAAIVKACSDGPNGNKAEQAGTGQPATRPASKSQGSQKPQPASEGRSR